MAIIEAWCSPTLRVHPIKLSSFCLVPNSCTDCQPLHCPAENDVIASDGIEASDERDHTINICVPFSDTPFEPPLHAFFVNSSLSPHPQLSNFDSDLIMKGPILLCSNCGAGFDVDASYTELLEQNLELLRSRNALLSADAVLFPEFIIRAEFDLFRCDREIQCHLDTVERLRRDLAEVDEYIKQKKSLLAPIRRLPPELLCAVFTEAIKAEDPTSSLRIALIPIYSFRRGTTLEGELVDVTYFGGSNVIDAMTSVILLAPNLRTLSFKGHLLSNDDGAPMPANSIRTFKADMILSDIGRFVSTIASMPELTYVTVGCFTCSHTADLPVEVLSHLVNTSHARLLLRQSSSHHRASTPAEFSVAVFGTRVTQAPYLTSSYRYEGFNSYARDDSTASRACYSLAPDTPGFNIQYLADTRTLHLAQLTTLELVWCQDVDEEMIIDMVEVRMACTCLRRVTLRRNIPQANLGDKARRLHLLGLDAQEDGD
ncbi:hypothetical protein EV421DRAFT_1739482 [Armillaria borealis]|uniref:Uncharacterized protein n=1 Tax=Armillaria borealis TaxID=47425 RepID=A0AA39J5M2_9AGAR|nr:hypothetical protein EV421DRAFT_1739482 [Armillaria borealis]